MFEGNDLPSRRKFIALMIACAVLGLLLGFLSAPLAWTDTGYVWTGY